jgi:hypothetical protein
MFLKLSISATITAEGGGALIFDLTPDFFVILIRNGEEGNQPLLLKRALTIRSEVEHLQVRKIIEVPSTFVGFRVLSVTIEPFEG